jgi:hypothetical protein
MPGGHEVISREPEFAAIGAPSTLSFFTEPEPF